MKATCTKCGHAFDPNWDQFARNTIDDFGWGHIDLGYADFKSGQIIVIDPCYSRDSTSLQGLFTEVMRGKWEGRMKIAKVPDWGTRVMTLSAAHVEYTHIETGQDPTQADFEIGVDSGTVGIFDLSTHKNDYLIDFDERDFPKYEFGDVWTETCFAEASSFRHGGPVPGGFVSRSGFGDGCYKCYFWLEPEEEAEKRKDPSKVDIVLGYSVDVESGLITPNAEVTEHKPNRKVVKILVEYISQDELREAKYFEEAQGHVPEVGSDRN